MAMPSRWREHWRSRYRESGFTLEELLRAADTACYMAKEKGRNRVHVYRADDSEVYPARRNAMVARIQRPWTKGACVCFPNRSLACARSQAGAHCEILLRMLDERGDLVRRRFYRRGKVWLMPPSIDGSSPKRSKPTRASSRRDARSIQTCSINLSGKSIGDDSFLDFLRTQARRRRAYTPSVSKSQKRRLSRTCPRPCISLNN